MIFTVDYGKGAFFTRCWGMPAMQCAGFQITLLRGAEWAATGKVKQRVPADFPTADTVGRRAGYKAD